jgi:hypothetical protein
LVDEGEPVAAHVLEHGSELRRTLRWTEVREQHPAEAGGVRGQPGADGDVDAHDAGDGRARGVADVRAVENCRRGGVLDLAGEGHQVRLDQLVEREPG